MDKDTRNIIATSLAAVVVIALPFFRIHPLIALLFGTATFFVAKDRIPVTPALEGEEREGLPPGQAQGHAPTPQELLVQQGAQAAQRFRELSEQIPSPKVADTVSEIGQLVRDIFKDFEEDPEDLRLPASQSFLHTNLDRAVRLVDVYAKLSTLPFPPPETEPVRYEERQRSLMEAEDTIELTRQGFQALLAECQDNDLRQLDMDSHVLTRMLEDRFPQLMAAERQAMEEQQRQHKAPDIGSTGDPKA